MTSKFALTDSARLLASPLGIAIFGVPVRADVYLLNPFRLIGELASASDPVRERAAQRFRGLLRLSPESATKNSRQLGYDLPLRREDVIESVDRLKDPRHRLVAELFWSHAAEADAPSSRSTLGSNREQVLACHAAAIECHNEAIASEIAGGDASVVTARWAKALELWASVGTSDVFWAYVRERAELLDDPRVREGDVLAAREQLPRAILGWNQLFAARHARDGNESGVARHLELIRSSRFSSTTSAEVTAAAAGSLVQTQLVPLVERLRAATARDEKLTWSQTRDATRPLLDRALELHKSLPGVDPESGAEIPGFDTVAEEVLRVLSADRLNYGEDFQHAIHFSAITTQRLLALPMTKPTRRRVESALQNDLRLLYEDFAPEWRGVDALKCWFLPAEPADCDSAILLPVHKINSVGGGKTSYRSRKVLVPRSVRARRAHEGKSVLPDPESSGKELEPACRRLLNQIRSIEAETRTAAAREESAMEPEIRSAQAAVDQQVSAHEHQVRDQRAQDKARIDEVKRRLQADVNAQDKLRQQALAEARGKAQPRIAAAEDAHRAVVAANMGLLGLFAIAPGARAVVLLAYGATAAIAGLKLAAAAAGGLIIGSTVVFGFVLAGWRNRRVAQAEKQVSAARATLLDEESRIEQGHLVAIDRLKKQAEEDAAQTNTRLRRFESEVGQIRKDGQARIEAIRACRRAAIQAIEQQARAEAAPLRKELEQQLTPKPVSTKSDFPAYRGALAVGYKDGEEPSEKEIREFQDQRMKPLKHSLSSRELELLRMALDTLDSDAGQNLIDMLVRAQPSERSTLLMAVLIRLTRS